MIREVIITAIGVAAISGFLAAGGFWMLLTTGGLPI
jgi:hypothetical protein